MVLHMFSDMLRTTVLDCGGGSHKGDIQAEKSHTVTPGLWLWAEKGQVAAAVPEMVVWVCICSPGRVQRAPFHSASSAWLHRGANSDRL